MYITEYFAKSQSKASKWKARDNWSEQKIFGILNLSYLIYNSETSLLSLTLNAGSILFLLRHNTTELSYQRSLVAHLVKNPPAMQETLVRFLGQDNPLEKGWLPTPVFLGIPCSSVGKESACNTGDLGSTPGLRRSPGEGKGYPLQYFGLENSMDCIVHGVTKSQTQLSDLHFHFQ